MSKKSMDLSSYRLDFDPNIQFEPQERVKPKAIATRVPRRRGGVKGLPASQIRTETPKIVGLKRQLDNDSQSKIYAMRDAVIGAHISDAYKRNRRNIPGVYILNDSAAEDVFAMTGGRDAEDVEEFTKSLKDYAVKTNSSTPCIEARLGGVGIINSMIDHNEVSLVGAYITGDAKTTLIGEHAGLVGELGVDSSDFPDYSPFLVLTTTIDTLAQSYRKSFSKLVKTAIAEGNNGVVLGPVALAPEPSLV